MIICDACGASREYRTYASARRPTASRRRNSAEEWRRFCAIGCLLTWIKRGEWNIYTVYTPLSPQKEESSEGDVRAVTTFLGGKG